MLNLKAYILRAAVYSALTVAIATYHFGYEFSLVHKEVLLFLKKIDKFVQKLIFSFDA